MIIKWVDCTPQAPHDKYVYQEAAVLNQMVRLVAMMAPSKPQPSFKAAAHGDKYLELGFFPTLTEAKTAAEKWFRQELLDLDF
jgi:hypothetical protein